VIYRYTLDESPFEDLHDAGMHVSREVVTPRSVEAVGARRCTPRSSGCAALPGGRAIGWNEVSCG